LKPLQTDTNSTPFAIGGGRTPAPARRWEDDRSVLSKPLMTVHEVAEQLKVREATVRTWIRDRQLRAIKFGKDWRVAVVDLETFLNERANK